MGISAKNLPHVFDRFWQADDSARRKYQGVGIGLALVKELAEVQGGQVTVDSEEGQGHDLHRAAAMREGGRGCGTETGRRSGRRRNRGGRARRRHRDFAGMAEQFYRRAELFPAMTPVQEALRPVETMRNGQHKPSLLVADDEPDMLRFLKSQLETHYRVLEAVDGQQAVDKAGQFLPDIILLDMMMPEKDGLQACREIRAQHIPRRAHPVILLTARADEETKLAALEAGASDFLLEAVFNARNCTCASRTWWSRTNIQNKLSKQNQVLESTIEQLKETESLLVQTEKLVSLGRMSAGIIHEINNPLNFATTGLYSLRKKGKYLAPEQRAEYEEILHGRGGRHRAGEDHRDGPEDVHASGHGAGGPSTRRELVTSALRFLSNEWKSEVTIEQKLDAEL